MAIVVIVRCLLFRQLLINLLFYGLEVGGYDSELMARSTSLSVKEDLSSRLDLSVMDRKGSYRGEGRRMRNRKESQKVAEEVLAVMTGAWKPERSYRAMNHFDVSFMVL